MRRSIALRIFYVVFLQFCLGCYSGDGTLIPADPHESEVVEEGFVLNVQPKVDILFLVDDSGSMKQAQERLADNINLFTTAMEKNKYLDYQIGVITSSVGPGYPDRSGLLQGRNPFVTREQPNGLQELERTIIGVGTLGNGSEKIFASLALAIDPELNLNPSFIRSDAFFILIMITDTKDQSVGDSSFRIYDRLVQMKADDDNMVLGYTVLSYPKLFGDKCFQDDREPDNLLEFMSYFSNANDARIGGGSESQTQNERIHPKYYELQNIVSLCDPNFGVKLANIGEDIRLRVSQKIPLPVRPVDGTIRLTYAGVTIEQKWWRYDFRSNSIVIDPSFEVADIGLSDGQFVVIMDESNPEKTIGDPLPKSKIESSSGAPQ